MKKHTFHHFSLLSKGGQQLCYLFDKHNFFQLIRQPEKSDMNSHKSVILPGANMAEFMQLNPQSPKGLGVTTAAIFLSGEMAGSGILALPNALLGTGWSGIILIVFFSINAAYIGTRLGLCWEILAEMGFEEFSQTHVRDPYPLIAEKAGAFKGYWIGRTLRHLASGNNESKYLLHTSDSFEW